MIWEQCATANAIAFHRTYLNCYVVTEVRLKYPFAIFEPFEPREGKAWCSATEHSRTSSLSTLIHGRNINSGSWMNIKRILSPHFLNDDRASWKVNHNAFLVWCLKEDDEQRSLLFSNVSKFHILKKWVLGKSLKFWINSIYEKLHWTNRSKHLPVNKKFLLSDDVQRKGVGVHFSALKFNPERLQCQIPSRAVNCFTTMRRIATTWAWIGFETTIPIRYLRAKIQVFAAVLSTLKSFGNKKFHDRGFSQRPAFGIVT